MFCPSFTPTRHQLSIRRNLIGRVDRFIQAIRYECLTQIHPVRPAAPGSNRGSGGQRKPREIRELVLEIAKLTGFGYARIIGEMRKIGIKGISRQTVRNILKEEGIVPAPDRTSDKWENILERHQNTLWAVGFFSVKSLTMRGIQELYVLVFLCLHSREVIVTTSTRHPNSAWVKKQTEMFIERTKDRKEKPSIVMHNPDTKFTKEFVATLKAKDIQRAFAKFATTV